MSPADRLLTWLIRINAVVLLLATVPIFLPTDLMAGIHTRLGLGTFPRSLLTEYLTRSVSACYVLHGLVLLAVSGDVLRYRRLIDWIYAGHLLFALTLLGIDLAAGMPWWWTIAEAGSIAGVAGAILVVNRWAGRIAR